MSSSLATQNTSVAAPLVSGSNQSSHLGVGRSTASSSSLVLHPLPSQFREIHKNTWLKRLTADGKKITVGAKKSEKNWVVFCVHDDSVALLEGYSEPRQTGAHIPEWVISLQDTLHISHALIPNSHEFEFVVTLSNEVIRFHAMSWDIMQEWVTTLRSKLREMKILSPKENLYTKLPEVRAPLLPTRDPTSPLPAPPPVPAAIVPGVERVIPQSAQIQTQEVPSTSRPTPINSATSNTINNSLTGAVISTTRNESPSLTVDTNLSSSKEQINHVTTSSTLTQLTSGFSSSTPNIASMSNTLSQNLLNMLSDPITAYSEQINESAAISNNENSGSDDLNLSDDEFLSPILRKSSAQILQNDNSSRNVDTYLQRSSADHIRDIESLLQCDRLIPRPQTSRSQSVGPSDKTKKSISVTNENNETSLLTTQDHITDIEINHPNKTLLTNTSSNCNNSALLQNSDSEKNVTIIQVSTNNDTKNQDQPPELPAKTISGDIFKFPETTTAATKTSTTKISSTKTRIKPNDYKSNVQIIPSNMNTNNSTIQVLNQDHENLLTSNISSSPKSNDYTIPIKSSIAIPSNSKNIVPSSIASGGVSSMVPTTSSKLSNGQNSKVTTVHVTTSKELNPDQHNVSTTSVAVYGTCFTSSLNNSSQSLNSSPKLPKKIILSANSSGITSISVNNNVEHNKNTAADISDKNTCNLDDLNVRHNVGNIHYEKVFLSSSIPTLEVEAKETPLQNTRQSVNTLNQQQTEQTSSTSKVNMNSNKACLSERRYEEESSSTNTKECHMKKNKTPKSPTKNVNKVATTNKGSTPSHSVSPALRRRHLISPNARQSPFTNNQHSAPQQDSHRRIPLLTRGLTEAAIITRHSRKDLYNLKLASAFKTSSSKTNPSLMFNNNEESSLMPGSSNNSNQTPLAHPLINRTNSELIDQRRRSSSTSDAQTPRGKVLGNHSNTNNNDLTSSLVGSSPVLRIQQPPLPFRSSENGVCNMKSAPVSANNSPIKRLTIREQQVMQIRREIMHPGGVRLQLRRKDCIGSIAWVEAFGAVWIAGWKQKEHPVLYNALHIGDQLITIAGVSISSPVEANKVIRNTNTLFVEVLVRRIPFGRAYAIRREREGQCLGLIRDGNTATIVDVVPNSLAARHGLPPKAQSCDGTSLTFWVLTEINGRPLNLFFKDNEIRDRLNSVGRDISILVQPSDLIAKLRKQVKSLRGYKDYLVQ